MNRAQAQIRAKYATACNIAKSTGNNKPDWEQWKTQYNYYGAVNNIYELPSSTARHSTTQMIKDNARKQEKAVKHINILIKNIDDQMDILDDFLHDISDKYPEFKIYHKQLDYIWGAIHDVQEKVKIL